jgi:hypothetical protein
MVAVRCASWGVFAEVHCNMSAFLISAACLGCKYLMQRYPAANFAQNYPLFDPLRVAHAFANMRCPF